jgi:hypothetical protein
MAALRRKKQKPTRAPAERGGITILDAPAAVLSEDLVVCVRQIITPGGFVLVSDRCAKDHPVVRAYPDHFAPLDEGGSP